MGAKDVERQSPNVFRMRLMGAEVIPVDSGSGTLKDAVNEAMRDWSANYQTAHYLLGTAAGPHPFPTIVREYHRMIGEETRAQIIEKEGRLPKRTVISQRMKGWPAKDIIAIIENAGRIESGL